MLHLRRWNPRVSLSRLVLTSVFIAVAAAASTVAAASHSAAGSAVTHAVASTAAAFNVNSWSPAELGDINPTVFGTALDAAAAAVASGEAADPATLTIIDFSRPSTQKRLWVYDLQSHALLFDELVSHGRGSGKAMATAFSNQADSNMSSLGLFRTAEAYVGKNGYSLRLDGLDRGVNDQARARAIVIHGAWYVSEAVAKAQGFIGRSLGCPAVRPEIARPLIDTIKGGGLVYAYAH